MHTKYKLIIWHALIVILAMIFWTYSAGVINQSADSFSIGPKSVVYLVIFTSVIALGFALFQVRWLVLSFSGAIGIPFVLAMSGELIWTGAMLFILLLLYSWSTTVRELRERSKVNMREVLRRGLSGIMLATLIAVSFAAYDSPIAGELERTRRS